MSLARLDHVIYAVPDIDAAHRELTALFPEAWPIGRFWPKGLTSGIAIGGLNLELVQPDEKWRGHPACDTIVFEPTSLQEARVELASAGLKCHSSEKTEPDPGLLRLRGFSEADSPQLICRNLLLDDPDLAPFEFFCCDYSPFLKSWLSPSNPRLRTDRRVTKVVYGTPRPEEASTLLDGLGYSGDVSIRFAAYDDKKLLLIETDAGLFPWP
ncbi:MAG: hypothetical protein ACHQ50_04125 [Fimbriimonadales bacterium]